MLVSGSAANDLTCASSTTLEGLATCIRNQIPQSGSNGFVTPSAAEQSDWRWAVNQMLQGACDFALPASLSEVAQVKTFADAVNGRNYCVLMEVRDADHNGFVDRGWGTFITYNSATRELSHQAPHPISDSTTELQAITIFKETDSRSYLMAGAHRNANPATSTCQSSYNQADVAHGTDNMFHAANQELLNWYGAALWNAIQWHGMAADICPNTHVYPSHGRDVTPVAGDQIVELRDNALRYHPAWDIDLPGAGACSLNATDNTQGRLLNGVAADNICGMAATSDTGRFIHIEQDPNYRNPADWINPIRDTWPVAPLPAAPANLTATAGNKQVSLTWSASANATSYRLYRSTISDGAYTTIATGVATIGYTEGCLTDGVTHYYVVTAVNAHGESGYSNQASATPTAPQSPPATPTGINALPGNTQVTLSWNVSAGATSYNVKRATVSGGPYTTIARGVTGASYVNAGLANGTTYYFVVSAVNAAGESGKSAQVAVTPASGKL